MICRQEMLSEMQSVKAFFPFDKQMKTMKIGIGMAFRALLRALGAVMSLKLIKVFTNKLCWK